MFYLFTQRQIPNFLLSNAFLIQWKKVSYTDGVNIPELKSTYWVSISKNRHERGQNSISSQQPKRTRRKIKEHIFSSSSDLISFYYLQILYGIKQI